jgi:hypothetical protein
MSEALTAVFQLMQQLMLLTLQLQGAPPEQRAAFSRSPAGTILLHVLRGVSLPLMEQRCGLALMVQDVASVAAAAAAAAGGQQVSSAAAGWQICVPNGRDLVELLLLPGLLLAPMSMSAACAPPTPTSSPGLVLNVESEWTVEPTHHSHCCVHWLVVWGWCSALPLRWFQLQKHIQMQSRPLCLCLQL